MTWFSAPTGPDRPGNSSSPCRPHAILAVDFCHVGTVQQRVVRHGRTPEARGRISGREHGGYTRSSKKVMNDSRMLTSAAPMALTVSAAVSGCVMMKKTSSATTMNATSSSLQRPPVAPLHVQFVVCIASDAPRVCTPREDVGSHLMTERSVTIRCVSVTADDSYGAEPLD